MLSSIEEVITALGGSTAVAAIAGVGVSQVSNWKADGRIPPKFFDIFEIEAGRRALSIDRSVFGFKREPAESTTMSPIASPE